MIKQFLGTGGRFLVGKSLQSGTAGEYDCWARTHNRTLPSTAVTLAVSSSSISDTSAGTGARTVRVYGLDSSYNPITEDFTLNGQTKVTGTKYFLRVQGAEVLTAGSGEVNAGVVYVFDSSDTVSSGVPQTSSKIFGLIDTGDGVSQMGMITVPAGYRLHINSVYMNTMATASHFASLALYYKPFSTGVGVRIPLGSVSTTGANWFVKEFKDRLPVFEEKTEIRFLVKPSAVSIVNVVIADIEMVPAPRGV